MTSRSILRGLYSGDAMFTGQPDVQVPHEKHFFISSPPGSAATSSAKPKSASSRLILFSFLLLLNTGSPYGDRFDHRLIRRTLPDFDSLLNRFVPDLSKTALKLTIFHQDVRIGVESTTIPEIVQDIPVNSGTILTQGLTV